jgi:hypothetical protein
LETPRVGYGITAGKVLQAMAPVLHRYRVLFKAPASLPELDWLNSGISYGYSQIGKFVHDSTSN